MFFTEKQKYKTVRWAYSAFQMQCSCLLNMTKTNLQSQLSTQYHFARIFVVKAWIPWFCQNEKYSHHCLPGGHKIPCSMKKSKIFLVLFTSIFTNFLALFKTIPLLFLQSAHNTLLVFKKNSGFTPTEKHSSASEGANSVNLKYMTTTR